MKKIYIVLIQSPTIPARLMGLFKRSKYTHATISLDEKLNSMFSFGRQGTHLPCSCGFKQESFYEGIYNNFPELPGIVLELEVTERQYKKLVRKLDGFIKKGKDYKYNFLGLFANYFGIKYKHDYKFFCSEFVYYVLCESGIYDLKTPPVFISPQELLKVSNKIVYEGNLKLYNAV